jgi:hypothetical protein
MNSSHITAILAVTSLAFSVSVMAQGMSSREYKTAEKSIAADYLSAKASCDVFADNARDICLAEAKRSERISKAELESNYKPSGKASYKLKLAKGNGDFMVAREKCDDSTGNARDVCVKEAEAVVVSVRADAKAKLLTTKANRNADRKSSDARVKAEEAGIEARHEAVGEKRNANLAVAIEKCDAAAGDAKAVCVDDAKKHFAN